MKTLKTQKGTELPLVNLQGKLHYFINDFGCWLWTKSHDTRGYGHLNFNGKTTRAHRFSWIVHYGNIPKGLNVLHRCDVRSCINPNHLFLGTYKDNRQDCIKKGRNPSYRGEKNPNSKLTLRQIRVIQTADVPLKTLARFFNISYSHCRRIRKRIAWSCI